MAGKIYGGTDPREIGSYTVAEASHVLTVSSSTLRTWVSGRRYSTDVGIKVFRPLIEPAESDPVLLSFMNLVEAHVLNGIRKTYKIPLRKVRAAIATLKKTLQSPRPLLEDLKTDGKNLFVEKGGGLINVSEFGQFALREILTAYLRRVRRDSEGRPVEFFPFSRPDLEVDPALITIDPRIAFGKPIVRGTGVPTSILAQRFDAGDSIEALAKDYGIGQSKIEEAIRYELRPAA